MASRKKKHILSAVVALTILVAVVGSLELHHCPYVLQRWASAVFHLQYVASPNVTFRRNRFQAHGPGPNGSTVDGSSATSSDCVTVGWGIYRFNTPADASTQFHKWVESATEIVPDRDQRRTDSSRLRIVLRASGFVSPDEEDY